MFTLNLIGSFAIGMVWGWLLGNLEGRIRRPRQTIPFFALATLAIVASIFWFQEWRGVLFFGAAVGLAFLIHISWRRHLRRRFESLNPR
jgi:hypothetical protein